MSAAQVLERRGEQGQGGERDAPPDAPPPPPPRSEKKTSFDVVIIGAGPAGYTAGIYCSRARRETLVLSGLLPGGQLVNTTEVENYPGFRDAIMGPDLMLDMRAQAERMGTAIVDDEVTNVDFARRPFRVMTASEEYTARAVIIATGASPRKLGVPGEGELAGKGVSYCATCDGPFFRGKEIVVVGGGDSAMEEATFLTKFASRVLLVHRRGELRASRIMQERAMADKKVEMALNTTVGAISGDGRVERVTLRDASGSERDVGAGGVFVAIGHEPNTALFRGQVELDARGYVVVRDGARTSVEGVFAAGDVHDHEYRQAITAAGFGCMAALSADRHLAESQ
ncbi:MAG: thioredoxin-disulfide reductase [Thaumarchaeota archaeon]|nr:thioredoxin-disulfide reductase [Nitrososphaerota archaeon]